MPILHTRLSTLRSKYWPLIKSLQTGLLLMTGLAGYMSCRCPIFNLPELLQVAASLFLAISGSTVLNMWHDRDIDAKMDRTCLRPLPAGKVSPIEALCFGLIISILGIGWGLVIDPLFGVIVFAGLFFDVVVYTVWLKRRSAWSIIFGGVSGAMPILAGRTLGFGSIDWIGIVFALAILFWIPTHILTFSMKYYKDYQAAGIPTFPSTYGFKVTRIIIAVSSILAALAITSAAVGIGMDWGYLRLIGVLSIGLLGLAIAISLKPSERVNFGLFKYASVFMLGTMLMIVLDVL